MGPKKKKNSAAGSGHAAVKAKKGGGVGRKASRPAPGPATVRVFVGPSQTVVTVAGDAATTVGDLRSRAVAAAVAAGDGAADAWAGCVLRRHDADALARGATTPCRLQTFGDATATLADYDAGDADPPAVRIDYARHASDAPEVPFASRVEARVAHVLVKHVECAGNVSRRTGEESMLTPAEARAELEAIRERVAAADDVGAVFAEAAAARSDCQCPGLWRPLSRSDSSRFGSFLDR